MAATGRHTIYEVAAVAGVSIATVSRVLSKPDVVSPGTRDRVLAAVHELNYVPTGAARSLAARNNEAFGLALPELSGPYYAELLSGFEAAAADGGASVMVVLTRGRLDAETAVRRLAGRVDAVAVMAGTDVHTSTLEALRQKLPVVTIAGGGGPDSFSTENTLSASALTTHLIDEHGRRRLIFLGDPTGATDINERYLGFVRAHSDRGLSASSAVSCEPTEQGGEWIAHDLLSGRLEADAVVCANDELALGLMLTLRDNGVEVPRELSVTGWDDILAARHVSPALTTVRQPVRELGAVVVRRINQLLGGDDHAVLPRRLPTSVALRESCGCA